MIQRPFFILIVSVAPLEFAAKSYLERKYISSRRTIFQKKLRFIAIFTDCMNLAKVFNCGLLIIDKMVKLQGCFVFFIFVTNYNKYDS